MQQAEEYDIAIVGGGPGGYVAATRAAPGSMAPYTFIETLAYFPFISPASVRYLWFYAIKCESGG